MPEILSSSARHVPLRGATTILRLVEPQDAAFIWGLRTDDSYNAHLSATTGTVEDQHAWITRYLAREAEGREYYFIVLRAADGKACGTLRVYDVQDGQFTWGSWILNHDKPAKAALDTAMLVYRFGFEVLGLEKSVYDVRRDNTGTLAFHDRFGGLRIGEDAENIYYDFHRARWDEVAPAHRAVLAEVTV